MVLLERTRHEGALDAILKLCAIGKDVSPILAVELKGLFDGNAHPKFLNQQRLYDDCPRRRHPQGQSHLTGVAHLSSVC